MKTAAPGSAALPSHDLAAGSMPLQSRGRSLYPGQPVPRPELEAAADHIAGRYGPRIGWEELLRLLNDRECVKYPCELCFDAEPLLPGEFGYLSANSARPEEGFRLFLHPHYGGDRDSVPYLVLQQIAHVNFGPFLSPDDAELFGSRALGIAPHEYYRILCQLSDQLGGDELC